MSNPVWGKPGQFCPGMLCKKVQGLRESPFSLEIRLAGLYWIISPALQTGLPSLAGRRLVPKWTGADFFGISSKGAAYNKTNLI